MGDRRSPRGGRTPHPGRPEPRCLESIPRQRSSHPSLDSRQLPVTPSRRDLTAVIAIVAAVAASLLVVRLTASGPDQGNATTAVDQPPSAWSTSAASDSAATPRSSTAPTPTATTTSVRREGQQ